MRGSNNPGGPFGPVSTSGGSVFGLFDRQSSTSTSSPSGFGLPTSGSGSSAMPGRGLLSLGSDNNMRGVGSSYVSPLGFGRQGSSGQNPSLFSGGSHQGAPYDIVSDFPSLSNHPQQRIGGLEIGGHFGGSARAPYVGMVKQSQGSSQGGSSSSGFQMTSEDFPALPGASPSSGDIGGASGQADPNGNSSEFKRKDDTMSPFDRGAQGAVGSSKGKGDEASKAPGGAAGVIGNPRGVQMSSEGHFSNIPPGVMLDQFGMLGLLSFIRTAETKADPSLVSLALGQDLTQLGVNLNSPDLLHPTFGGPWSESPLRPQDVSYSVPHEYMVSPHIRNQLAQINLGRYGEDLLFYIFYMYVGDLLQIAAAAELYDREWRFHKVDRVWITRAPGVPPAQKTSSFERGTYFVFDILQWKKVAKDFILEYDKLDARPIIPAPSHHMGHH
ncbi:unnamed protein product [Cyprideis torosa]|uniref:NOT2/NOT3/NOT5 C-terminal domain-containing protein n=1 Tax=Cyprideis torosa TaxID=163714 RepID=A0A7R8WGM8_9CRUS|nr:unnamed protein product [Cyprideis torosa]CAG0893159.1 unnamed protein product [Cyprideis torosa]